MLLVPTDFSPCAERAVERAISMAKAEEKALLFLHVIVPPSYTFDLALGYPLLNETLRPAARQQLARLVKQAKEAGVSAESLVFEGLPSVKIVEIAKERRAELLLMGTHGRTGLSKFLIGSTTDEVVRRAPCPVLIIRDQQHDPQDEIIEPAATKTATGQPARAATPTDVPPMKRCLLCNKPSAKLSGVVLCASCTAKIEAEARETKRRIEEAGRVDVGRQ